MLLTMLTEVEKQDKSAFSPLVYTVIGLPGIRERLALVGGTPHVQSSGHGTL